jgi:uncharacterized ion transporter superfamily protein YfcC
MTEKQLREKNKKLQKAKVINALLIGFCIGVVVWSVYKNTWGFFTLVPLFLIYKLVNRNKKE